MSLFHPPSPLAPDLGRRTSLRAWTLTLALAAFVVVLGLALTGRLAPEPAAASILAVAAVTGLVWVSATPLVRVVRAEPEAASRADILPAEAAGAAGAVETVSWAKAVVAAPDSSAPIRAARVTRPVESFRFKVAPSFLTT